MDKLLKKLAQDKVELRVVYEAGPCGFVLCRHLRSRGIHCEVIAPSLIPKKASDRVKTDRRDADQLARLHRAGELTAIHVPDQEDEAIRDLVRARTSAMGEGCQVFCVQESCGFGFTLPLNLRSTGGGCDECEALCHAIAPRAHLSFLHGVSLRRNPEGFNLNSRGWQPTGRGEKIRGPARAGSRRCSHPVCPFQGRMALPIQSVGDLGGHPRLFTLQSFGLREASACKKVRCALAPSRPKIAVSNPY